MADTKISAMTPATVPLTGAETLPLVQSGGNVKATLFQVTAATYGEIYVANGAATQTLTSANTFYTVNAWTTDGLSNGITLAAASDKITVDTAGVYLMQFFITFSDANNKTFTFRCYNNTAASAYANTVVKASTHSTDPIFVAVSSFIHVDAGDDLVVQAACATAGTAITISDANFALMLLKAD
jgi:hypothetical protein